MWFKHALKAQKLIAQGVLLIGVVVRTPLLLNKDNPLNS